MDADEVAVLRLLLEAHGLEEPVAEFAATLGTAPQPSGGLLVVGTPEDEPWHFTAHLADEARYVQRPELAPTLVRWHVPENAPPHLSVSLARIEHAARNETFVVVAPDAAPAPLLERLAGARKAGALLLAMETGDRDLRGLAHESLTVPDASAGPYLDVVQHVVSAAAGTAVPRRLGVRDRIGRLLDRLQGAPQPPR